MSWKKIVDHFRNRKIVGGISRDPDQGIRHDVANNVYSPSDQRLQETLDYQVEKRNRIAYIDEQDLENDRKMMEQLKKYDLIQEGKEIPEWTHEETIAYYRGRERYYYEKYRSLGFSDSEIQDIIIRILEDR